jgi:DNA-binding transcriptional ArsR family regulator
MTKTLETKRKILQLLKRKEMTISELSAQLNLSSATVSQHINELVNSGAIEKVDNQYFKKLKYYRAKGTTSPVVARYVKYVVGAVIVLALLSGAYIYSFNRTGVGQSKTTIPGTTTINSTANASPPVPVITGAEACPMFFYNINGSIENYSGFEAYSLNYSNSTIADYVISDGNSGKLYVSELVSHVLPEPSNSSILQRQHYVSLEMENGVGGFATPGLNVSILPENFTIANNETLHFVVNITANSTAANTTYWLRIDGPCGGGVMPALLTIGAHAYNGTVKAPNSVFA